MFRWIPVLFCVLLFPLDAFAKPASATACAAVLELPAVSVDWGGGVKSRGEMTISDLTTVQSAEYAAQGEMPTPIHIKKPVDLASPMLRQLHGLEESLPRVVIRVREPSSGAVVSCRLRNVRITSYAVSGWRSTASEELTLTFESIRPL